MLLFSVKLLRLIGSQHAKTSFRVKPYKLALYRTSLGPVNHFGGKSLENAAFVQGYPSFSLYTDLYYHSFSEKEREFSGFATKFFQRFLEGFWLFPLGF